MFWKGYHEKGPQDKNHVDEVINILGESKNLVKKIVLNFLSQKTNEKLIKKVDDFKFIKEHGKMKDGTLVPFRQLPILVVEEKTIAQTGAIARFSKIMSAIKTESKKGKAVIGICLSYATILFTKIGVT